MNDTPPEIEALQLKLWLTMPPGERLIRGALMFDAARELVLASFPPGLSEHERLRRLAECFYGPEIAAQWAEGWRRREALAQSATHANAAQ